jgi:transcriptional regulator with XRE-family HTH domain
MNDFAGDVSLGARIRQLRAGMFSQRELADAAGVSTDVIRKLEQEVRHTASITTLQKIAQALDVDLATLFGTRASFPSETSGVRVMDVQRALAPVDDLVDEITLDGEPLDLDAARRVVDYAWGLYRSVRFEQLTASLPNAFAQLRATEHAAPAKDGVAIHELLARCYWVASCLLSRFGQLDAAWLGIREALKACEHGADPLLDATVRGSAAWQLMYQGRFDESARVALRAANVIEPAGDVPVSHLSVYGSLVVDGASAHGRYQQVGQARELLAEGRAVADRIGVDRNDYETAFGPSQVILRTVEVSVVTGNFVDAVDAAKTMPRDTGLPAVSRSWHLAHTAYAHTMLGQIQRGKDTLFVMAAMAPEWIRHHELVRQAVAELVRRDRDPRLRVLVTRLGVRES